ncbi:MAG: CvpA family protein [Oscillospiraceae bacterium]
MALTTIINLILVGIIIVCAWQGFKKGIIMGIIGVLVIILSLYGAQLLSDTFSYEIIPVLKPFVGGVMDTRIEDTAYSVLGYEPDENGDYHVTESLADILEQMPESRKEICRWAYRDLGIYDDVAEDMAQKAVDYADENGASLSSAITAILCQSISWYGGFLLAFILVFAALTVLVNLPNLSFHLPYIGLLNNLVGLGIGIFTGFLFCSIIVWVLQFTGLVLPQDTIQNAGVAAWFLDRNLLASYITL